MKTKTLTIKNPFDAHIHWRQIPIMNYVSKYSILQFSGGLLMPNTDPKIIKPRNLVWYKDQVKMMFEKENEFLPIFTYYLSPDLNRGNLLEAWNKKDINGVKYYPKGGTTGSEKGLIGFYEVRHLLEAMQKNGIPLLIHGETPALNDDVVDDFERERIFMETEMAELVNQFPELKISLEHITTKEAVQFVMAHENIVATITPQHLLLDSRALFNGVKFTDNKMSYDLSQNGMMPKYMCRPILKKTEDVSAIRRALVGQATEGWKKFGLGTDSAPHTKEKKYCECGACGVFSAPIALELYACAFEQMGILKHLQTFASDVMPTFYGIKNKLPKKQITLIKKNNRVQENYSGFVTPFAGQEIPWRMVWN